MASFKKTQILLGTLRSNYQVVYQPYKCYIAGNKTPKKGTKPKNRGFQN